MNLDSRYYGWEAVSLKGAYRVKRTDEGSRYCVVDLESPHKNPLLPDHLSNSQRMLIVSKRLKECLEKNTVPDVEFSRLSVMDPTGRLLDDSYFLVRFLNPPACLDLDASGAVRSRLLPAKAEKLKTLVFKSDPNRPLFHPAEFNKIILVSAALAEALSEEGFSGFRFMGLFDYGLKGDLPPNPARSAVDALCKRLREAK